MVEKYRKKRNELYTAFMELDKCMIKFVENCGECCMNVKLIKSMIILYDGSRAYVSLGSILVEYSEVKRRLIQRCVMSPWLFNIFFDRVIRQVNERPAGMGVKLRNENGGSWEIKHVLYADDKVLVT